MYCNSWPRPLERFGLHSLTAQRICIAPWDGPASWSQVLQQMADAPGGGWVRRPGCTANLHWTGPLPQGVGGRVVTTGAQSCPD